MKGSSCEVRRNEPPQQPHDEIVRWQAGHGPKMPTSRADEANKEGPNHKKANPSAEPGQDREKHRGTSRDGFGFDREDALNTPKVERPVPLPAAFLTNSDANFAPLDERAEAGEGDPNKDARNGSTKAVAEVAVGELAKPLPHIEGQTGENREKTAHGKPLGFAVALPAIGKREVGMEMPLKPSEGLTESRKSSRWDEATSRA